VLLTAGCVIALAVYLAVPRAAPVEPVDPSLRNTWRLPTRPLTLLNKVWLLVLRAYLVVAAGLVLVRILTLAAA
jgi:hypothetical protein